jgi:hypothetical protein
LFSLCTCVYFSIKSTFAFCMFFHLRKNVQYSRKMIVGFNRVDAVKSKV